MYSTEEIVALIMAEDRDIDSSISPRVTATYWIADLHEYLGITLDVMKQVSKFSKLDEDTEMFKRLQYLHDVLLNPYAALNEQLANAIKLILLDDIL